MIIGLMFYPGLSFIYARIMMYTITFEPKQTLYEFFNIGRNV